MKYLFLALVCVSFAGCSHSNNGGGHVVGNHLVPPGSEMPAGDDCGCNHDDKEACACKPAGAAAGSAKAGDECGCGDHHKVEKKKKKGRG